MKAVFIKKTYNDIQLLFVYFIIYVTFDKFVFRAFNHLAYNQDISGFLVASYLLGVYDYYISLNNIKIINLVIL